MWRPAGTLRMVGKDAFCTIRITSVVCSPYIRRTDFEAL
jgi:hypothetical protein